MQKSTLKKILVYVIAILIPLAIGALSAVLTMDNMDIYSEIITPPLAPPSWLFPVVWTILYILMGVSSGIVWTKREKAPKEVDKGIAYYALSLAFNFAWSIIFFNLKAYLFAFIWLLLLLGLVLKTITSYHDIDRPAAYLQIPYALWVAFAGYLNFGIFYLNP